VSARIPIGAFEHYVAMGNDRSYEQVASHFHVTKRAVTKAAARERWSERLEKIERDAQTRVDEKLTESIEQMRLRHSKMLRAMAGRAVKALQEFPLTSGMEGLRAAEAVIKLERLVAGEVTERGATSVEVLIKNEFNQIMVRAAEAEASEDEAEDDDEHDEELDEADDE